jgi:hypothetical protein
VPLTGLQQALNRLAHCRPSLAWVQVRICCEFISGLYCKVPTWVSVRGAIICGHLVVRLVPN